jgi:hypothetical protein
MTSAMGVGGKVRKSLGMSEWEVERWKGGKVER